MTNIAQDIIIPPVGVFRTIFLYVGQGEATLMIIPEGYGHKYVLIDSNHDEKAGGINLPNLLKDLFGVGNKLDIFINTHPHRDHLAGIKEIYDTVGVKEVWHSGHRPGRDYEDTYEELQYVISKVGRSNVFLLKGSNERNKLSDGDKAIGEIDYQVLAPAEYVSDEIENEKPETRYARIHEQCAVIKFSYGDPEKSVLITGDADYNAWTKYITPYHQDILNSTVLSVSHHGSRTFFWEGSPDDSEPYLNHIQAIDPSIVVISAPKENESRHNHPHQEAMELYTKQVGEDRLYHLGRDRISLIVDINKGGQIDINPDYKLVEKYGNGKKYNSISVGVVTTIDRKPHGA